MLDSDALLEVIAATVEDAVAAEAGGASRLEIVRALDQGGLTPSVEVVREICGAVSIPVRVMVRESPTFTIANAEERRRLWEAARDFAALGVDGLVLGFLNEQAVESGGIDVLATAEVLACAPGIKATFHRAFEAAQDPARAMAALKRVPQIDRILARGGDGSAQQRRAHLEALAQMGAPHIRILAGGNLTVEDLPEICNSAVLREFHVGSAARDPEKPLAPVSSAKVRQVIASIRGARERMQSSLRHT